MLALTGAEGQVLRIQHSHDEENYAGGGRGGLEAGHVGHSAHVLQRNRLQRTRLCSLCSGEHLA